jgi:hypothetical protein
MFIRDSGKAFPAGARAMEVIQVTPKYDVRQKPKWLVPLGKSYWPEKVITEITGIFLAVGLGDPLTQKLVEPFCNAFNGYEDNGEANFDEVNWEFVIAYFRHEAIVLFDRDEKAIVKSREAIWKKFRTLVRHYEVYGDPKMPIG